MKEDETWREKTAGANRRTNTGLPRRSYELSTDQCIEPSLELLWL